MKLRRAPRIFHKIRKLTDRLTNRVRGRDDVERKLMETKQTMLPRLMIAKISAHTDDGTPRTGSESAPESHLEENLAHEHGALVSLESSASEIGPASIVAIANQSLSSQDQALSLTENVPSEIEEVEGASSSISLVSVRKRPYEEANGLAVHPDLVIKRAKHSIVHNYAAVLRLMKDMYLNVRDIICDQGPEIDRVTSMEIKYAQVLSEMRSMFSQVEHYFQELLLDEKDTVMYEAGHI
ncbi:uncharacterized protein MELLADRAFT_93763 [Melampsora larici-populina 98AG31]|uniref:Uncharacterized protein n=1 Tax=Melampsora larici-populina (strain 98AG31 / pathotype 3-4-7) TaxID=747676 RepID=F4R365_MELLP|nr:uncharacterized protein MELLADRAFT_86729 [Melampsora larici-populina 98AG31]XP_007409577.1 uncharacterized protein MELLADRAFT_86088 [Melampsora larici-populina 98AG31]XP_007414853.1 uncharacterized protein MELLADRAFT_91817 [Melampsora larici-populina 98AG31]XP_007416514.1 uncharacterized protein MELLADRAFT_93763 [Melampsora larici-populina 98AG31]EGG00111.1 hypothetical protein MELLADRAFT_93763 [Melampsora larici-populina 98AG31]EGG01753.1 hypothetical protein MELLADRAFT_91817 [Melampsora l